MPWVSESDFSRLAESATKAEAKDTKDKGNCRRYIYLREKQCHLEQLIATINNIDFLSSYRNTTY